MKISNENLLNINVDVLFEQYNVTEIDQIYNKLQNDIEAKKEELRTMVGERYRDLLQAADTIGDMRKTSTAVINNISEITTSCRHLNEQQLIGFKIDGQQLTLSPQNNVQQLEQQQSQYRDRNTINNYGISVQIQLLTILPELIWTNIDNEQYFIATQLFIFARHISTGLQLDINESIMKLFPIAKNQWTILSKFFFTIKYSCLNTLEREDLTAEAATKCLASLLLLQNCPMKNLIQMFLQLRSIAFKSTICEENSKYERVRDKILASLKILINTLELLFKCFCVSSINHKDGGGLLNEILRKLTDEDAKPTITLIETENSLIINTLPDIIAKYKPHIQVTPLKADVLKQAIDNWLAVIGLYSIEYLNSIINIISSIKIIHDIERKALSIEKPLNWLQILQNLSLPVTLDFYQLFYHQLMNCRIKEIIKNSWNSTVESVNKKIQEILQTKLKDTKQFVWTEESSDIPLRLKEALSTDKQCHKLLMKVKGYAPEIINVINLMDSSLKILNDDLKLYLENLENGIEMDGKVHTEIVKFLKDSSREGISQLITNIKSLQFNRTENNIIFLARLLQSITELCPNLKLCLYQNIFTNWKQISAMNSPSREATNNNNNNNNTNPNFEHWDSVCGLLEEESVQFWKLWLELFIKKLIDSNELKAAATDLITLLMELPNWDTISIEEKDEQENTINSTIRIPSQPSFSLQQFLHCICNALNDIVPHTLPQTVLHMLSERIIRIFLDGYEQLPDNEFIKSHQNASLQYIYDVKFISILLGTRDNKKNVDALQNLSNRFKSNIDPFDFELFHKYLNQNVKRSVSRMQHQLGCLIVNMDHLNTILGNTMSSSITTASSKYQEKDPNVLALSTNAISTTGWFTMLPVMIPDQTTTNSAAVEFTEKEYLKSTNKRSSQSTTTSQQSNERISTAASQSTNSNSVRSSASTFFGVMPQDWFR